MPRVPGLRREKSSGGGRFGFYTSIRTPGLPGFELKGHATARATGAGISGNTVASIALAASRFSSNMCHLA
jgi:hypothetical protein